MQTREQNERFFSIELNSKHLIKNLSMIEEPKESILIEGTIGKLIKAIFDENVILLVIGTKGILRLDLKANEIKVSSPNGASRD